MKIGVFDSGVGGITVLTEIGRRFPFADYVYMGDTAHVPYGNKSPAQIERLSAECALVLQAKSIDALVVACNTASGWALPVIEKIMSPVPVFGVVGPGVEAASATLTEKHSAVLVLATRATVQSQAYDRALRSRLSHHRLNQDRFNPENSIQVLQQACPLLVPMIEEGWIDHSILHQTVREYVQPFVSAHSSGVALLGCTHYPWIHSAFEKAMPGWVVVNSARAVAESLQSDQSFEALIKNSDHSIWNEKEGSVEWIFTDVNAVPAFAKSLLNERSISKIVSKIIGAS